ncbi:Putative Gluconolactonase [Penicillium brasilianum]|uniref:Putative Gluconolactonase n=1 Tax=Penicillium brasilianum TaxID=104259 RepID=A0A0F7VH47_PENBI|nr:Putative Gluconolactonase [Penicillium brasilianum]
MNFYPVPPVIQAEIFVRIPDALRCTGQPSDWRSGSSSPPSEIFLEGPTYLGNGDLYVTDIPYGRILKIDSQKQVTECVRYDGEPNGLVGREDGCMIVADYKQGLLLFDPVAKTISPFLTRRNLERFKGPNDLIVSSKHEIYFTDQGQTGMTDQTGRVYRLSPDGKLDCLVDNGVSPNGIVLSPDERFLYVAMTRSNAVCRLPLHADGSTSKAGLFFQSFGCAGPDGLAIDEEGNLFICHPSLGSVFVVDADGVPKARIVTAPEGGKNLTNCTFGGDDGMTIFITDSMKGNIQCVRWHCKGAVRPH